jgi:hypothetical protein
MSSTEVIDEPNVGDLLSCEDDVRDELGLVSFSCDRWAIELDSSRLVARM